MMVYLKARLHRHDSLAIGRCDAVCPSGATLVYLPEIEKCDGVCVGQATPVYAVRTKKWFWCNGVLVATPLPECVLYYFCGVSPCWKKV